MEAKTTFCQDLIGDMLTREMGAFYDSKRDALKVIRHHLLASFYEGGEAFTREEGDAYRRGVAAWERFMALCLQEMSPEENE